MLIGIDASKAAGNQKTGVENVVYRLILNLQETDKENIYFLYTDKHLPSELLKPFNFMERYIPFPRFWHKLRLPVQLRLDKPQLFLEPSAAIPLFAPQKSIAIVHDLAWHYFPQAYSQTELILQRFSMQNIAKKAQKIICVSNSTKKDFDSLYPEARNRCVMISPGYSKSLSYQGEPKIKPPYILFVGRIEERKNIGRIIEAFNLVKSSGQPHKLVLVGKPGNGFEKFRAAREKSNFKNEIVFTGYLPDKELALLYQNSDLFLFPSLYEGFGMPVLEAMSNGIPVVTSKTSSLKEISQGAALLVNPEKTEQITEATLLALTDKVLRKNLIAAGHERVSNYSWKNTVEKIKEILETM